MEKYFCVFAKDGEVLFIGILHLTADEQTALSAFNDKLGVDQSYTANV